MESSENLLLAYGVMWEVSENNSGQGKDNSFYPSEEEWLTPLFRPTTDCMSLYKVYGTMRCVKCCDWLIKQFFVVLQLQLLLGLCGSRCECKYLCVSISSNVNIVTVMLCLWVNVEYCVSQCG